MNHRQRQAWLDHFAHGYLEALMCGDAELQAQLWDLAIEHPDLVQAFEDVQEAVFKSQLQKVTSEIEHSVMMAMPCARIERPAEGPVTIAEVADELGRTAGPKIKADGYAFVETLSCIAEALPAKLGQSQFAAWAEQRFPGAPAGFWPLFHKSSLKVERRRESQIEYQLAARRSPKPPEDAS